MRPKNFYILCFSFFSLNVIAQADLNFSYYFYSNSVSERTYSSIYLKSYNETTQLLCDTVSKFEYATKDFFKSKNYVLVVEFENKMFGKDSLNYPFDLDGNEIRVDIDIRLYNDRNNYQNNNTNEKSRAFVEVIKYFNSTHALDIQYLPNEKGNEYFREPFFLLKNNSKDTIYGEHLPGFFWGTISIFVNDSTWSKDLFGNLDTDFALHPPLYPDSTKLAWVGSFGWRNNLPKNRYKYTLLYTTNENSSIGAKQYLEKDNFVWRTDTKKYYQLIYEFDIE